MSTAVLALGAGCAIALSSAAIMARAWKTRSKRSAREAGATYGADTPGARRSAEVSTDATVPPDGTALTAPPPPHQETKAYAAGATYDPDTLGVVETAVEATTSEGPAAATLDGAATAPARRGRRWSYPRYVVRGEQLDGQLLPADDPETPVDEPETPFE